MATDAESRKDASASWSDSVDEIERRRELAGRMGGEERVARQRAQGSSPSASVSTASSTPARSSRLGAWPERASTTQTVA